MADETQKYLINIESNLNKYAQDAVLAKQKTDELKAIVEALKKAMKDGVKDITVNGESFKVNAENIEAFNGKLKNSQVEYSKAQKMVQLQVAANSSEAGSRKQLGEILKIQEQELGKLGSAYTKNAQGILTLNPLYAEQRTRIANTKQAIIDYDLALNDGRSNIGRYSESIKGALAGLSSLPGPLGRAAAVVQGFSKTTTEMATGLNSTVASLSGFGKKTAETTKVITDVGQAAGNEAAKAATVVGGFAQSTKTGMDAAGKATTGFGATIKALSKTIFATPIGWIIAGIAALVAVFTGLFKVWSGTASGAGKLKDIFASLHAIIDVLRARVVSLIEAFGHLFRGEFKKAGEDMKATFAGVGAEIANAAGRAAELSRQQRALSKDLAMHVSEEAKENEKTQEYIFLSKDKTKSDKERLNYLKMAMDLSREKADKEIEYAQRQLNIDIGNAAIKAQIDEKTLADWIAMNAEEQKIALEGSEKLQKAYNLLGGSDAIKKLEEAQAAVTNANAAYFQENKRTTSQLSSLENELQTERETRIKELITLRELESDGDIESTKKALKYKYEQEIKFANVSATQKLILKKQYENDVAKLDKDAFAEYEKNQEKQKEALKTRLDQELALIEQNNNQRKTVTERQSVVNETYDKTVTENKNTVITQKTQLLTEFDIESEKATAEERKVLKAKLNASLLNLDNLLIQENKKALEKRNTDLKTAQDNEINSIKKYNSEKEKTNNDYLEAITKIDKNIADKRKEALQSELTTDLNLTDEIGKKKLAAEKKYQKQVADLNRPVLIDELKKELDKELETIQVSNDKKTKIITQYQNQIKALKVNDKLSPIQKETDISNLQNKINAELNVINAGNEKKLSLIAEYGNKIKSFPIPEPEKSVITKELDNLRSRLDNELKVINQGNEAKLKAVQNYQSQIDNVKKDTSISAITKEVKIGELQAKINQELTVIEEGNNKKLSLINDYEKKIKTVSMPTPDQSAFDNASKQLKNNLDNQVKIIEDNNSVKLLAIRKYEDQIKQIRADKSINEVEKSTRIADLQAEIDSENETISIGNEVKITLTKKYNSDVKALTLKYTSDKDQYDKKNIELKTALNNELTTITDSNSLKLILHEKYEADVKKIQTKKLSKDETDKQISVLSDQLNLQLSKIKKYQDEIAQIDKASLDSEQTSLKESLASQLKAIEDQKQKVINSRKAGGEDLNAKELFDLEVKTQDQILKIRADYVTKSGELDAAYYTSKKAELEVQLTTDLELNKGNLSAQEEIRKTFANNILQIDNEAALIAQNNVNQELIDYAASVEAKKEVNQNYADWDKERQLIDADNNLRNLELRNASEFEIQRASLKMQYDAEIKNAKKSGADVNLINKNYALAQRKIDVLETQSKLELAAGFAGNLATIFGKQTAIGKAAAIAQTTINTYASAVAAFKSMAEIPIVGPALGAVAAGAAVAMGIANIKQIMAVNPQGSNSAPSVVGAESSAPTSISSAAPAQRSFTPPAGSSILNQPQLSQSQLNAFPNSGALNAEDIGSAVAKEFGKLPAPRVTVEDINVKTGEVNKVKVMANI